MSMEDFGDHITSFSNFTSRWDWIKCAALVRWWDKTPGSGGLRQEHGTRTSYCPVCWKMFTRAQSMLRHFNKVSPTHFIHRVYKKRLNRVLAWFRVLMAKSIKFLFEAGTFFPPCGCNLVGCRPGQRQRWWSCRGWAWGCCQVELKA